MAKGKRKEEEEKGGFSEFEQANKGEAAGDFGGPNKPEDWTMAEASDAPDTVDFEPSVKDETRVLEGVLFACDPLNCKVSLMTVKALEGPQFDMTEGVECELNGVPTEPEDLKRGDKVVLTGDPVVKIVASR